MALTILSLLLLLLLLLLYIYLLELQLFSLLSVLNADDKNFQQAHRDGSAATFSVVIRERGTYDVLEFVNLGDAVTGGRRPSGERRLRKMRARSQS